MSSKPCANPTEHFIELTLTEAQTDRLNPMVHAAAADGRNTLFVATSAPFWSVEEARLIWRFQVVDLHGRDAHKIVTAIRKLVYGQFQQ
jgi:hypothetical protein